MWARRALAWGLPRQFDQSTRRPPSFSLEFTIVPISDAEGRLVGMAAILRDVTSRFEELKTLRRRLAERDRDGAN